MAFEEHRGTIVRYFSRRTSDPSAVEDRVQEVFARLAGTVSSEPVISWKALLLRVARSVVVDQWRREKARNETAHLTYDDDRCPSTSEPEFFEALVARDRLARLKTAIFQLDTLERDIVLLARL